MNDEKTIQNKYVNCTNIVCYTHTHTRARDNHKTKMFQYLSIFTLFYEMLLLKRNITSHHKWWCEHGDYFMRSKQTWRECFFRCLFYSIRVLNSFLEFIFSNDIYSSKVAHLCVCTYICMLYMLCSLCTNHAVILVSEIHQFEFIEASIAYVKHSLWSFAFTLHHHFIRI